MEGITLLLFILIPLFWILRLTQSWVREAFDHKTTHVQVPAKLGRAAGVKSIQGARPHMEDMYWAETEIHNDPKKAFFGVYDGHGGHRAAKYTADRLHKILLSLDWITAPAQSIIDAFVTLDKDWLQIAQRGSLDDGTTAITALIVDGVLYSGNVGDSRAVMSCRGKALDMSNDHKPTRDDEKQRIEQLGGRIIHYGTWRVEGVLAVTRAIGDRRLKKYVSAVPEIQQRKLQEGDDFLILASDGVWDVLTSQAAVDIVTQVVSNGGDASLAANRITDTAYQRRSPDNITTMVVDLRQFR